MKAYIITVLALAVCIMAMISVKRKDTTNRIEVGSKVPDFSLYDQNGKRFHLYDHLGKRNLVIFFYPKDETPGCTREACSFRDRYSEFTDANAEIIGISSDGRKSHSVFAARYKLPYPILSDEDQGVHHLFGVPRNIFGLLPGRVTYVIDKQGIVRYIFNSQTQAEKHADEAIRILKSLK